MNNNKTSNASDDDDTAILIAPLYDSNAFNGNGGNRDVCSLTGNIQVIEYNHIGQNIHTNYICTLTDVMVWIVDNIPEKLVNRKALKSKNTRDMSFLSDTKRKQRKFLKSHFSINNLQ